MKTFKRFLMVLVWGAASFGFASTISEYSLKAACLYNFSKFVDWPEGAFASISAPLVIGVLGEDPFGKTLDEAVSGKSVNGHPLAVKRLGAFTEGGAGSLKKCHILFIAYSESEHLLGILGAVKGEGVLTVSEIDKFPVEGGMILFDQEGQKISLVVNPKPIKKAGLTLSSKLMQVAKVYN